MAAPSLPHRRVRGRPYERRGLAALGLALIVAFGLVPFVAGPGAHAPSARETGGSVGLAVHPASNESCGVLAEEYPFLLNGSSDQPVPPAVFGYPEGNGTPAGPPLGSLPPLPNMTYGELSSEWAQVCNLPAFAALSARLPASDFGIETATGNGNASIETAYRWGAACPQIPPVRVGPGSNSSGNVSYPFLEDYTPYVNWSAPNVTGAGCAYVEGWSMNFFANGSSNVSGPWRSAGVPLLISVPPCEGPCGASPAGSTFWAPVLTLGTLGGVGVTLWLAAGLYNRRHPPTG